MPLLPPSMVGTGLSSSSSARPPEAPGDLGSGPESPHGLPGRGIDLDPGTWTVLDLKAEKSRGADGAREVCGFRLGRALGEGSFGKVVLAERETSAEQFAVKVYSKGRLRRQREFLNQGSSGGLRIRTALDKVQDEVRIMRRLTHPSCVRLHAVIDEPGDEGKLYLVLEYAAGGPVMEWNNQLSRFVRPGVGGAFPERAAAALLRHLLTGLRYLHGLRPAVAHRDVKPQNLLLDDGRLRLADFGVATELGQDFMVKGTEGTYWFYSPEMCRTGYTGHDARRADVWAAGISLWAFLTGTVPFLHQDLALLMDAIAEARCEPPPEASAEGRAFLRRILAPEAAERPLSDELLTDPWLAD